MQNIVIIGGGYGGLRAIEHLYKREDFHITLIDKNPFHYMQTEAYGYIAGRFDISDIAIDLQSFIQGLSGNISFVQDEALHIDKDSKEVVCKKSRVAYDYMIVAVGAQTNFFSFIKGLQEHTKGVKSIQRAFEFRQAFEQRISAKLHKQEFKRDGDLKIAVAGAGLSGVEIAAEMAYTLQHFRKILPHESQEVEISLIDAAPTILPGMDPYIIEKTEKRLDDLKVKIYTNAFISQIGNRDIEFKDGKTLSFDFIIFTAGIKGADFVENMDAPKNRIHQVMTDETLRVCQNSAIFAIGDCAEIKDASGKLLPPTAQVAEKSAAYVAKSIIKLVEGEHVAPFDVKIDGVFVALGGKYAIGTLYEKIKVEGYLAYLLKKVITRFYRFGLELKVNAGYKKRKFK
ncbi:MAG: FAD-dependent oxidoreductase [Epsilonproteobacteria bacterium]|nr:FAD-dependent oxidoreductase [Campylobacterota bacterium]